MKVRKMRPIIIEIPKVEYSEIPKILSTDEIINQKDNKEDQSVLLIKTLEKYIEFLYVEIIKRQKLVKRSNYINTICFILEITLFILDAIVGFIGLFFNQESNNYIILQICLLCTSISGFLHVFIKKTYSSNDQQLALLLLAENRYQSIHAKYLSAKSDNIITPEEYNIIVDDFKLYENSLNEIIKNGKSTFDIKNFKYQIEENI